MKEKTFTESMSILQNAASEISKQNTTLEDALALFEKGIEEAEYCKNILDEANQKITIYEKGDIDA